MIIRLILLIYDPSIPNSSINFMLFDTGYMEILRYSTFLFKNEDMSFDISMLRSFAKSSVSIV
jgi:hypothetical protein